ncbi:MAG: TonB-dependent receptor, partial [Planctomycetes bacterium]|nr:TonB-dependent receptor [Planctomycetota bacterium]
SIGTEWEPLEKLTLRASYNQTIARQTFKELTPVLQQEFLGGPIFIGNPELEMSALRNYDLRADYVPNEGGLLSISWFRKDIDDPIEYVQRLAGFNYTTPINFPEGTLTGYEFEVRQRLGNLWEPLENFSAGANATLIESEVTLSKSERDALNLPNIQAPQRHRKMTAAPEYLLNFYLSYEILSTGTQASLFYTHQGDTLLTGGGQADGNFVPSVFAEDYGTLNLSVGQRLGEYFSLTFQAKNLTNPKIQQVYRSRYIGSDVTRSSFRTGIEFSLSLSAELRF